MKKTIVICAVVAALLLLFAVTAAVTGAFAGSPGEKTTITNYGGQILYDATGFSNDQIVKLEELIELGRQNCGRYVYQEKVVIGQAEEKEKYITEADAKSIVSESSSYDEIVEKFEKLQKYPDYVGGSGTTLIEYWLDGDASSKIIIIDTQKSIYIVTDENNGVYERLF